MIVEGLITKVNGYVPADKWYTSARILSDQQEREHWHAAWGTATKDRGKGCPRCKGRGYTRKDGNVGCNVCLGLGVV